MVRWPPHLVCGFTTTYGGRLGRFRRSGKSPSTEKDWKCPPMPEGDCRTRGPPDRRGEYFSKNLKLFPPTAKGLPKVKFLKHSFYGLCAYISLKMKLLQGKNFTKLLDFYWFCQISCSFCINKLETLPYIQIISKLLPPAWVLKKRNIYPCT